MAHDSSAILLPLAAPAISACPANSAVKSTIMNMTTRRKFLELAASFGATLAWGSTFARESKIPWRERRDVYPQGVASGDPHPDSVILWTRRPPGQIRRSKKVVIGSRGRY